MNDLLTPISRETSILGRINNTIRSLSLTGSVIFYILLMAFGASTLSMLWKVSEFYIIEVPARGGTIIEGILGIPRYINPVLAVTDSDKDLTALIYSGLMRQTEDGTIAPDLAESYSVSPDGKTYTFILRPDLVFHDGKSLSADDIIFTIEHVQMADIKSPKRAHWVGVKAEKIDDRTIVFTLEQPYAPFINNTTIGILPKHLWKESTAESFALEASNIEPIGSGPYAVKSVKKDKDGIPKSYRLMANKNHAHGAPLISTVIFKFYQTEQMLAEAYVAGGIDNANSLSPATAIQLKKRGATIYTSTLPRVFGIFFNEAENEVFSYPEVRQALDMSVDRNYIVNTVLQGFGTALTEPVPQNFAGSSPSPREASGQVATSTSSSNKELIVQANALLDENGWIKNADGIREKKTKKGTTTLAFSISTSEAPELNEVAEIAKNEWKKVGADVSVKVFEGGHVNQNIIRPRKYEALLFGQIISKDLDLYAFWHSSQRADPGLNIALYSNEKADKILENLRTITDKDARKAEYAKFQSLIREDVPALFLYAPDFVYAVSPKIRGIADISHLTSSSERFDGIESWHINTERIWKAFAK